MAIKKKGIFLQKVRCKLTDEELIQRGQEHAEACEQIERVNIEKKAAMASYRSRLNDLVEEEKMIREVVETRSEEREVECIEKEDAQRPEMVTYRCDTLAEISRRAMTEDERQGELV